TVATRTAMKRRANEKRLSGTAFRLVDVRFRIACQHPTVSGASSRGPIDASGRLVTVITAIIRYTRHDGRCARTLDPHLGGGGIRRAAGVPLRRRRARHAHDRGCAGADAGNPYADDAIRLD